MLQTFKTQIESVCPLLMGNGQLANPSNPYAKALKQITSKRDKTEADMAEIAKIEWYGSLYLSDGRLCLPESVLDATLFNASKKKKKGKQAAAGLFAIKAAILEYDGPKNPDKLWEDERFRFYVNVKRPGRGKIMRMRPIIPSWSADVEVSFNDETLNPGDVKDFFIIGGRDIGLMDWRPKYGRFIVV